MPTIVIRLDPAKLQNPDLDLRYDIPDMLAERSGGLIADGGYDYETAGDAMHIYLRASDVSAALPHVLSLIETERVHDNALAPAAQVGVSEADAENAVEFRVVYPLGAAGVIRGRP